MSKRKQKKFLLKLLKQEVKREYRKMLKEELDKQTCDIKRAVYHISKGKTPQGCI